MVRQIRLYLTLCTFILGRNMYKDCRCHSYGDDPEDDQVSEDIATEVTQAALANGTAPSAKRLVLIVKS